MITIINNMIIHRSSTTIKPVEVQSSTQAPSGSLTSCSSPEEKIFTLITDRIGTFYVALLMSVQQTKTSYKVSLPTVTQADKISSGWCLGKTSSSSLLIIRLFVGFASVIAKLNQLIYIYCCQVQNSPIYDKYKNLAEFSRHLKSESIVIPNFIAGCVVALSGKGNIYSNSFLSWQPTL